MILPDVIKTIRRIQIISNKLAQDILAGAYHSAFKGKGIEFEEVREYQPGDEVRTIDWNVTARMNHPYVKSFREERNLTVLLLIDLSASLRFGSQHQKKSLVVEIGALLAFSAIKNNDRIGLVLFSDRVEKYIPPGKGVRHILRLIRELLLYQPKHPGSDIKQALEFIGNVQQRSCVCFLISDFLSPSYTHDVAVIAKKHDLIAICITDPYEKQLPEIGLVRLKDLETEEEIVVDTAQPTKTGSEMAEQLKRQEQLIRKMGGGWVEIQTDQSYVRELQKFFKLRARKR